MLGDYFHAAQSFKISAEGSLHFLVTVIHMYSLIISSIVESGRSICACSSDILNPFHFYEKVVLTEKGLSRSKWKLKNVFEEDTVRLIYHYMKKSRIEEQKPKYFQSAIIGQEFEFNENKIGQRL